MENVNGKELSPRKFVMVKEPVPKKPNKVLDFVLEIFHTIMVFVVTVGVVLLFITFVGQRTVVSGSSMEGNLSDGDNLFVNKLEYKFSDPERFDVIVFPHGEEYYIKRIIGLPGEKVLIDVNGSIFINGEKLDESYGREVIKDAGTFSREYQLAADEYFVLGDNRNNSLDSRFAEVGPVKADNIIGHAIFRLYPFDKINML